MGDGSHVVVDQGSQPDDPLVGFPEMEGHLDLGIQGQLDGFGVRIKFVPGQRARSSSLKPFDDVLTLLLVPLDPFGPEHHVDRDEKAGQDAPREDLFAVGSIVLYEELGKPPDEQPAEKVLAGFSGLALPLRLDALKAAVDGLACLRGREWLAEIIIGAMPKRPDGAVHVRIAGDDDADEVRKQAAKGGQ